jgi:nitrogen fixation protein FixH
MNATHSAHSFKPAGSYRWPLIIVGLLLAHLTLMGWAVMQATGDPNNQVIPQAYQKSLAWDELKARRAASAALGWKLQVAVVDRVATFTLTDGTGAPVPAGSLDVSLYHEARPETVATTTFASTSPGTFSGPFPYTGRGFYRLSVVVKSAEKPFETVLQTFVP